MFVPVRCPHRSCSQHHRPAQRFYRRHGYYRALCRPHPIARFLCRFCGRSFSRQTFRMDYRDHRPDLNVHLFRSLASGLGLRQTSRNLRLSLRCTELKFCKIARHLRRLNLTLRGPLPQDSCFQLDEIESYESCRNTRPLSVPFLIESRSRFVLWAEAAAIRPRGRMSAARLRRIARDHARYGLRRDLSRRSLRRTLQRGADLSAGLLRIRLHTDRKASYPALARAAFGAARLIHHTTSSTLPRTVANPLFPINHTEAMARDLGARLRRESWLASKKRRYLDLALQVFMAYRNYVRRRFNRDEESPAQVLGFLTRRAAEGDLLTWRQDWGSQSIHPLDSNGNSKGIASA